MRILLDTNVLVRANERADGPSRTLLNRLISQRHTLLVSNSMLVELARVLRYPRVHKLYNLTEDAIYQIVWFIRESAVLIWPDE